MNRAWIFAAIAALAGCSSTSNSNFDPQDTSAGGGGRTTTSGGGSSNSTSSGSSGSGSTTTTTSSSGTTTSSSGSSGSSGSTGVASLVSTSTVHAWTQNPTEYYFDGIYGMAIADAGPNAGAGATYTVFLSTATEIDQVTVFGRVLTVGNPSNPGALTVSDTGDIYYIDRVADTVGKMDQQGVVTPIAIQPAQFPDGGAEPICTNLRGITRDANRNLYVSGVAAVCKIDSTGTESVLAGNGTPGLVDGPSGTAELDDPQGIVADNQGNIIAADANEIRKIDPTGTVTTLAGKADAGFADGPAANALFNRLRGISMDSNGNIYVADELNLCIRELDTQGNVSTLAGNGGSGTNDGTLGRGGTSTFGDPFAIAAAPDGTVYVGDGHTSRNSLARQITH